jgi:hypothetical protein
VNCACSHLYIPTLAHKLYKIITYTETWTLLHDSAITRHPQGDVHNTFQSGRINTRHSGFIIMDRKRRHKVLYTNFTNCKEWYINAFQPGVYQHHASSYYIYYFFMAQQPPSGPGPPQYRGFTITLRHTPHSVGLLWTSNRPDAETSTWQHTTLTRDRYPCPPVGFEPAIPVSKRTQTRALDRTTTGIGIIMFITAFMYF